MVSVAAQVRPLSERRFFTWMSVAMAAAAFAGFARTYFLAGFNDGPKPVITPSVHIHGALSTAWILLLIVQTRLIANGRRDLHKLMGLAGVVIGLGVLVMGIFIAIHSERRVHTVANADTLADPYVFMIFPFTSVLMFAVFATFGVLKRNRPESHKRFMLLATASMIVPALARIVTQVTHNAVPGAIGALVLVNVFIIAMVVHDFQTRGRLHPVTLWAGAAMVLSEPLRVAIGFSAPWQAFARMLMG
jgi:FtsH-binding integral membrane protein